MVRVRIWHLGAGEKYRVLKMLREEILLLIFADFMTEPDVEEQFEIHFIFSLTKLSKAIYE